MKQKKVLKVALVLSLIVGIGIFIHVSQMNRIYKKVYSSTVNVNEEGLEEILDNSSEIRLERKIFSLKKHYYILCDGVLVGEVTGKVLPVFGDILELKDINGNLIKKEYQVKRMGPTNGKAFNLSFDRLAEIKDKDDNVTSYIGEEKIKDLLKLNHNQYFYNSEYGKIGTGKTDFFILCKDYKVYDNDKNIDYVIDGNIFSLASKYTIYKKDSSNIDEEDIIFYTIIENSIINSKITNSSGSSSSNKK